MKRALSKKRHRKANRMNSDPAAARMRERSSSAALLGSVRLGKPKRTVGLRARLMLQYETKIELNDSSTCTFLALLYFETPIQQSNKASAKIHLYSAKLLSMFSCQWDFSMAIRYA